MVDVPLRPMLACKAPAKLTFPYLASPKIDGVRAIIKDGQVLSRSGKLIPNEWIQKQLGSRRELNGLDGEIVVGPANSPSVMQDTVSGVMTVAGQPQFTFWVFDYFTSPEEPYFVRWHRLRGHFGQPPGNSEVELLPHFGMASQDQLDAYEKWCLEQGYEGVMLRSPGGKYKFGRSTAREAYLMKLKRFVDGEAEIIGAEELMRNANELTTDELGYAKRSHHKEGKVPMDTLGSLVVRDLVTGVVFGIGTGFTAEQRRALWTTYLDGKLVGKIAKYKHFAVTGVKDAPRFSVFLGFRDPIDM